MSPAAGRKAPATPLLLSHTDGRLIHAVHTLRFATALDLTHFLGFSEKSLTYVRERLARLAGGDYHTHTYLFRFGRPHTGLGATEKIYALGARGRDLIRSEGYYRPSKFVHLSYATLTHDLTLTRFVCAAQRFSRTSPDVKLSDIRLCYELARDPERLPVIPDAYLRFVKDGKNYPLWLECDNFSEFQQQWKKYLRRKLSYIRTDYPKVFHTSAVLIAYVVAGPTAEARDTRRQTLCRYTMEVLRELGLERWAAIFRFASVHRSTLYEQPLFSDALWQCPDSPSPVWLLTP